MMHVARHLPLRRLIALLMLCALPLHAYALHCSTHCVLAGAMMEIDMPGHDCGSCDDQGAQAALCAVAQAIAITQSPPPASSAGSAVLALHHDAVERSHIPTPLEKPPRPS